MTSTQTINAIFAELFESDLEPTVRAGVEKLQAAVNGVEVTRTQLITGFPPRGGRFL